MRDNKFHTPFGVRDYLPNICHLKINLERRIESVFHQYGYSSVESPIFEYVEVLKAAGIDLKQMYTFIDRDGEILALRSDITPAIARIAATSYGKDDIPLRFCYTGHAFRYNKSYQGKLREFAQSGIELIGINSPQANGEALAVAIHCLQAAGLLHFRIDIGQVEFLKGALEEGNFSNEESLALQQYMLEKNYVAVEEALQLKEVPKGIKKLLSDLPMYMGGLDVLDEARKLVSNKKSLAALDDLQNVYRLLEEQQLNSYISFDLSMMGHLGYYTGIIFSGYTRGCGFSVLDGGRYDKLLSAFGAPWPSTGFAVKINDLLSALQNQKAEPDASLSATLLVCTEAGRRTAQRTADVLRKQGLIIENSLLGDNLQANTSYARHKKMGGILYFADEERVQVIDLSTGTHTDITIAELLQKGGSAR